MLTEDLPVLMEFNLPSGHTSKYEYWKTLGVCTLRDTIDVKVIEGLDGVFHVELIYPEDGWKASEIKIGRVLKVRTRQDMTYAESLNYIEPGANGTIPEGFYHRLGWEFQPFYINDLEYDESGMLIVRAVHYTYRLQEIFTSAFETNRTPERGREYTRIQKPFNAIGKDFVRYRMYNSYTNENFATIEFRDLVGTITTDNTHKGRVKLGDVNLYQNIAQFSEVPPWLTGPAKDNWAYKTFTATSRNFHDFLLNPDENSLKGLFKFDVMRDKDAIIMTDNRSMKTWKDAYEVNYSRDIKRIKVRTDMSDILTAIFPYTTIEDEFTYQVPDPTTNEPNRMKDVTVTCKFEANLVGAPTSYPFSSLGIFHLLPVSSQKASMYNAVRMDLTSYVDTAGLITDIKQYRQQDGTYYVGAPGTNVAAAAVGRTYMTTAVMNFLKDTDIQYGKATAEVDFVSQWNAVESQYRNNLTRLRLGDPIIINHEPLKLKIYARVTETNFNSLTGEYESLKLKSYSVIPY
jgi:hypothetical protein